VPEPVPAPEPAPEPPPDEAAVPPRSRLPETVRFQIPPSPPGLLDPNTQDIDLNTALRLAQVQNPEFMAARQRVTEAVALRQLAAAKFLPSINAGTSYDNHAGVLQQSNGNMLTVNRASVLVGAGVNAVAAGTVGIPGVVLQGQTAEVVFGYLVSRQFVRQRAADNIAVRNQVFLKTATAYTELVRAEGRRAIAIQNRDEVKRVAELTASYASSGEGRQADAHRAAAELAIREADVQAAEGEVLVAAAMLAQQINVDPSIRLHPTDAAIVPLPVVPDPIPVNQLIALAMLRRPEMESMRAAVQGAFLTLQGMKALPFTPTVLIGYSAGGYGGGSNLVRPIFGGFGGRSDFDAIFYWTLRNMGIGNIALIRAADARLQMTRFDQITVLNRVREEVAESYALTHARFAQIGTTEQAVREGLGAFERDFERIRFRARQPGREVLPIELLNSFRLLARSRSAYLEAIVDYNVAQFQLYVALGQPPANALSRPVPSEGIAPSTEAAEMVPSGPSQPAVGPGSGPFAPVPVPPMAPAPDVPQVPQAMAPRPSGEVRAPVAMGTSPALDDDDEPRSASEKDTFVHSLMGTSGVLDDQTQRTSFPR
jgi:outer membrane protein TolC